MWEVEIIPDRDHLYVRIHINNIKSDTLEPKEAAFSNTPAKGNDLSSDWNKYATITTCRETIAKQKNIKGRVKNPDEFFFYLFKVNLLRELKTQPQKVEHSPIYDQLEVPDNRAHTSIIGSKPNNAEFRVQMKRAGAWAEQLPNDLSAYRKEKGL